jgi:hypothetical protein
MADLHTHVEQAAHNEKCARLILNTDADARDWAITATFYAALHLAEACFSQRSDILHTESAPDRGNMDQHKYREERIRRIAPNAYKSYRKLSEASYFVRYLPARAPEGSVFALLYYTKNDAWRMLDVDLQTVRDKMQSAFRVPLSWSRQASAKLGHQDCGTRARKELPRRQY